MLIFEILILVLFCLFVLFGEIYLHNIHDHEKAFYFYFRFFQYVIIICFYFAITISIIKIIIALIKIIISGLKTKLYLLNLFQFIVSILHIMNFIYIFLPGYHSKYYIIHIGIPLLTMAFGFLLFQIYYINNISNNRIRILLSIILPIFSVLINFEIWRLNAT